MEKFSPCPAPSPQHSGLQITAENHTWLLTWNIWNWRVFPCKSDTLFVYSVSVRSLLLKELTYFLTYLSKNWHFTQTTDNRIVRKNIYTWRFSKNLSFTGRAVWKIDKCWKKLTCVVKITHLIIVGGSSLSTISSISGAGIRPDPHLHKSWNICPTSGAKYIQNEQKQKNANISVTQTCHGALNSFEMWKALIQAFSWFRELLN